MFIKSINLSKDKNKLLWFIILGALAVASILIMITVTSISKDEKVKLPFQNKQSIFSADSYYAKYKVNVKSNKNINSYTMTETYKNNDGNESFHFVTENENSDKVEYIVEDNNLKIKSENQKNEYNLSEYIVKKKNLLSISTFTSIYNQIKEVTESETTCAKLEIEEADNNITHRIILGNEINCTCKVCTETAEIRRSGIGVSKLELIISDDTTLPKEYIIYDKDGNGYIDIVFEEFDY